MAGKKAWPRTTAGAAGSPGQLMVGEAFAAPALALAGTSEKSGGQVGQEANFKVSRSSFCRKS